MHQGGKKDSPATVCHSEIILKALDEFWIAKKLRCADTVEALMQWAPSVPPQPLTATLGLLAVMTREPSSDPQWGEIAWTEINTTTEWESEGIDSSAGSLSVSRLP